MAHKEIAVLNKLRLTRHKSPVPSDEKLPIEDIPKETKTVLRSMWETKGPFYALLHLNTRPYYVTKNDILIIKRLPGVEVGDVVSLKNVREFGNASSYVRASEINSSKKDVAGYDYVDERFFDIKAVVLEQCKSAKYTQVLKRPGKGGGDRKFRKRSYRDNLSVIRVTKCDLNEDLFK
jgi:ribosomal protein L21